MMHVFLYVCFVLCVLSMKKHYVSTDTVTSKFKLLSNYMSCLLFPNPRVLFLVLSICVSVVVCVCVSVYAKKLENY